MARKERCLTYFMVLQVHKHEENLKEYSRLVDRKEAAISGADTPPLRLSSAQVCVYYIVIARKIIQFLFITHYLFLYSCTYSPYVVACTVWPCSSTFGHL